MEHEFEDIEVKSNAPQLLESKLKGKRKRCMIGTGAMTDPYIHLEQELGHTRKCLEIIEQYGFGLTIQTKSSRILRDLDLLKRINKKAKCVVQMTLTTYDETLCKIIEPNVSTTKERAEVLNIMRDNGIPTVVWICPILPYINDTVENMEGILRYCVEARVYGIINFGIGVTLREGNREYFYKKLDVHFPGLKEQYQTEFGYQYSLESKNSKQLMDILVNCCKKHNIVYNTNQVFEYLHTFESNWDNGQLSLF